MRIDRVLMPFGKMTTAVLCPLSGFWASYLCDGENFISANGKARNVVMTFWAYMSFYWVNTTLTLYHEVV